MYRYKSSVWANLWATRSRHFTSQCDTDSVSDAFLAGSTKIPSLEAIDPASGALGKASPIDDQVPTIDRKCAHWFCRFASPGNPGNCQQFGQLQIAHARLTHSGCQARVTLNRDDRLVCRFQLPRKRSETEGTLMSRSYPWEMRVWIH